MISLIIYIAINFYLMGALDEQQKNKDESLLSISERLLVLAFGSILLIIAKSSIEYNKYKLKKKQYEVDGNKYDS